jgi:hypothetical protein
MLKVDMPLWATHRVINGKGSIEPALFDNGKYYCEEEMIASYIIEDGSWSVIDEDKESPDLPVALTKREHFAALAMQGILSHSFDRGNADELAAQSIKCADALLKELSK